MSSVDRENPWPGLAPFTEAQSAQFFGRDAEVKTLSRRVQGDPLTVLFGQSGLGKSSLLQAGVFPRLRSADFCPVYLRLDHSPGALALGEQVKQAVLAETARAGRWTKAGVARSGESLWEFFHHRENRLVSPGGIALSPVLVFDQFEELFTLGGAGGAERQRAVEFMTELAELVENRPPEALVARVEQSAAELDALDFGATDYRVVITLREDYLPHLESLKAIMPALMDNRMRLTRMTGTQALDAVLKPGAGIVTEDVARTIVEFVAGARGGSVERLAELDVEPPLLSVICRELNERRRALGQPQITADLVTGNRREILTDFYERSVTDLPEGMRRFVEDKLLTKSGFRDNLALETALEEPGVTRPLIDTLVARRLLRIEDRIGTQRVELTHDVLADVVRASRDARQQRLALEQAQARERAALAANARRTRRMRLIIGGLTAAVCALLVGAFFGIRAQRRAEAAQREAAAQSSRTDFIFGSQLLDQDKVPEGLAYLVRAARSDPTNNVVGPRLISALAYRSFAEPIGTPLPLPAPLRGYSATYLGDGSRLLTIDREAVVRIWDRQTNARLLTFKAEAGPDADWTRDGTRLAICAPDGISIWDLTTGRRLIGPLHHAKPAIHISFSPDGRWLAAASSDPVVELWDAASGELKATLSLPHPASRPAFSPDGEHVCTPTYAQREWRIWRVPDGTPVIPLQTAADSLNVARFSPDGRVLLLTGNRGGQLFDAATGEEASPHLDHAGPTYSVAFSPDGKIAATASDDATVKLWAVPSGKLLATLVHSARATGVRITPDSRNLITSGEDGMARVWDIATGRLALEPVRVGDVGVADLAPDGREFLTVGRDQVLRRWGIKSGEMTPLQILPTHDRLRSQRSFTGDSGVFVLYRDRLEKIDALTGKTIGKPVRFPVPIVAGIGGVLSTDGRRLYAFLAGGAKELWLLDGPQVVRHSLGDFTNQRASFSDDSSRLAVNVNGDIVRVWDCASGRLLLGPLANKRLPTFGNPFSPDGKKLLVYSQGDNAVQLLDVDTGKPIGKPLVGTAAIGGMNFSPNGRTIAVGFQDGRVLFWDADTARPLDPVLYHRNWVRSVIFSPDGKRLLTHTPVEVRLWDVATGAPLTESVNAGNDIFNGVFSDDGTRFATRARSTGEVRIWGSLSGQLLSEPLPSPAGGTVGGTNTAASFGFLDSGRLLSTGVASGALFVWPVPPQSGHKPAPDWLLALAEAMAGGAIDSRGSFREQAFAASTFDHIRTELAALPNDAPYVTWGRWILADRATRPIAPGFTVTPAEADKLAASMAAQPQPK